ncbi:prepilin-type N-terminal cleavage/methylation domain-containing protein [Cobetia sp. SIMBA_158]|uniref:prepilin-type N-terminal cleavage/methylation domain-containing protein n=1 Tax=Cobetia sp. SIMBA_158 TaxID=3081617 RepID=UPI0039805E31
MNRCSPASVRRRSAPDTTRPHGMKRQAGVGLVELMISLVLGLLITAMAVQMFSTSRSTVSTQEALSYLQESARYVSFRLQPLMRNVGYAGCANSRDITNASSVDASHDLTAPFGGQQRTQRGLSYFNLTFVAASKDGDETTLTSSMTSLGGPLSVRNGSEDAFVTNEYALVSDCSSTDVFRVSGITQGNVETNDTLSRSYGSSQSSNAYLYPVQAWELRLDDQANDSSVRSLYIDRIDAAFAREELASGVQGFDVSFSLDTTGNGSVDRVKVPAATVRSEGRWDEVRRIEIALTLESLPGVVPGGDNDGRLTRTFNLTFTPRNLQLRGG